MVIFFTVTLGISIVGLLTLILLKRWEMSSGHVVFSGVRPAVGAFLGAISHWVEGQAPSLLQRLARKAWYVGRALLHRLVAWGVLFAERLLERTLHLLRHNTSQPKAGGEASAFLIEVSKHKKTLLKKSSKKPNAIYEE